MQLSSPGHSETHDWLIEPPVLGDVKQLRDLAASAGRNTTPECWETLVAARHVVCARDKVGIVGFYAAHVIPALYEGQALRERTAAFNTLCNRFRVANSAVGFGTLAAIRTTSTVECDLRLHLLRALMRNVGLRYRYLFTAAPKSDNHESASLSLEGWRCFLEEDETSYMMLNIARALRQLATRLVLPEPSKELSPRPSDLSQQTL